MIESGVLTNKLVRNSKYLRKSAFLLVTKMPDAIAWMGVEVFASNKIEETIFI